MKKENLQIGKQCINRVYLVVETLLNYEQDKDRRTLFAHTLLDEFEKDGKAVIEE